MSFKILTYPNKFLRTKTKNIEHIDKQLLKIINKMKIIMLENNGIGLAANQIGLNLSLFIAKPKEKFYIFINPEILDQKNEEIKEEGCLSLPDQWGIVKRFNEVKIRYQDSRGKTKLLKTKGLLAHIIQHEVDHLNGILFIDKALEIYHLKDGEKN